MTQIEQIYADFYKTAAKFVVHFLTRAEGRNTELRSEIQRTTQRMVYHQPIIKPINSNQWLLFSNSTKAWTMTL